MHPSDPPRRLQGRRTRPRGLVISFVVRDAPKRPARFSRTSAPPVKGGIIEGGAAERAAAWNPRRRKRRGARVHRAKFEGAAAWNQRRRKNVPECSADFQPPRRRAGSAADSRRRERNNGRGKGATGDLSRARLAARRRGTLAAPPELSLPRAFFGEGPRSSGSACWRRDAGFWRKRLGAG